jgi:hypothetical protein
VKEMAKIVAGGGSAAVQIAGTNVAEVRRNREHITKVAGMVRLAAMQSIAQRGYDEWSRKTVKGKVHPRTGHEGLEGSRGIPIFFFLTSALGRGEWSTPRTGRFTPGKENQYPFYRRLGRSGQVRKISL